MDEEEPAWRAELREAIHRWDEWEIEAPLRMQGGLLDTLIPHIKAAEERGRREALTEAAERIRKHPGPLYTRDAAADLIDPAKPESP